MSPRRWPWLLAATALLACSDPAPAGAPTGDTGERPDVSDVTDDSETGDAPDSGDEALEAALRAYCGDDFAAVEARLDELLDALSLEEKVTLMHGASGFPVGGAWEVSGSEALGIPPLRMLDGPRGVSSVAGRGTAFPVAAGRGATWDPELERRVGEAIGREVRAKGAGVVLAPVLNLVTHPRWGRAQESYSEDPVLVGTLGVAFIEGAQRYVLASAKHFAANNIEDTRFGVNAVIDERTLREVFLPQFRRAVEDAHVASVMSAYNQVNGAYCSESVPLLRDVLKGEWVFQGFVESDWYYAAQTTVGSALGGLDLEMPAGRVYGAPLVEAVRAGDVDEAVVDEAVRRILRATLCFGLDADPPVRDSALIESAEHLELAREVARRSLVLLENDGVLPLDRASDPVIAVLGPLADLENIGDTGSSAVAPSDVVTAIEGLRAAAGGATVTSIEGGLEDEADRALVTGADVVLIFAGLTSADEGEGSVAAGDRESLNLPAEQVALIEAAAALNESVVVVLEGGSAFVVADWVDEVEGLLMAWYPGQRGGEAIADVLFGDANPSGRLPVAFPRAEADLPPFDNTSSEVVYPRDHGYRHLDREGIAAAYAFGFGLSYTRFELGALALSAMSAGPDDVVTAEIDVTNAGDRAGIETVQLYVGAPDSALERPVRALKTFTQVALEPGETQTVTLHLPVADLAYYDVDSASWRVEPMSYRIEIGASEADLPLSATLSVVE